MRSGALGAAVLTLAGIVWAENPEQRTLVYRLRGEVRPLLFWIGRDRVGGGRITITRTSTSPNNWREQIEVLFGSDPARVPRGINRWGYGRETAEWVRDGEGRAPRLLRTEFDGMMKHSAESSMSDIRPDAGAHAFDVTRSVVSLDRAWHDRWTFTDGEDFSFRRPDRLLAKYRIHMAAAPPLHTEVLARSAYAEPFGFLTAVREHLRQIAAGGSKPRPLVFVFNAKRYLLEVTRVRRMPGGEVAVDFQTFNTARRTRTDFEIRTALQGDRKGIPTRIVLQPRWWLRLQLDLEPESR